MHSGNEGEAAEPGVSGRNRKQMTWNPTYSAEWIKPNYFTLLWHVFEIWRLLFERDLTVTLKGEKDLKDSPV